MGTRIPLVEHSRPRILAFDFPDQDVRKISELGFNVRRGDSGIYNQNKVRVPWSIHDVEILFANVSNGTFSKLSERTMDQDSVELGTAVPALIQEIWAKEGWSVFFIKQNCNPKEFTSLNISGLGVLTLHRKYIHASRVQEAMRAVVSNDIEKKFDSSFPQFPDFIGDAVILKDDHEDKPITDILKRYIKTASHSVLATGRGIESVFGHTNISVSDLITDESSSQNALAIKITKPDKRHYRGNILFLPDFGKNNINIAIALLQGVIAERHPGLFDVGSHKWLENYLPHTVRQLRAEQEEVISNAKSLLNDLSEREKEEFKKFNWLLGLLTGEGDDFRDYTATALQFLGFDVQVIDTIISLNQPLKEDLHISDQGAGYFAIGETKSTKRGASEDFLKDVQKHQGRFSRELNTPVPNAVLIVNHSTDFDPSMRAGRLYTNPDIEARCVDQYTTVLDSVALFSMCQSVLEGKVHPEDVRQFITAGFKIIRTYEATSA